MFDRCHLFFFFVTFCKFKKNIHWSLKKKLFQIINCTFLYLEFFCNKMKIDFNHIMHKLFYLGTRHAVISAKEKKKIKSILNVSEWHTFENLVNRKCYIISEWKYIKRTFRHNFSFFSPFFLLCFICICTVKYKWIHIYVCKI